MKSLQMIVPAAAYDVLIDSGELITHEQFIPKNYRAAYLWMASMMTERIGPAPEPVVFPLWAWAHEGEQENNPNLRFSCGLPEGSDGYILEFDVPDGACLLSDFIAWDGVLNGNFFPRSEEERRAFFAELEITDTPYGGPYLVPQKAKVEESWKAIFDLEFFSGQNPRETPSRSVQATLWNLKQSQITKAELFTAIVR